MATDEAARFVRSAGVSVTSELVEQLDSDVRLMTSEYLRRLPNVVFHRDFRKPCSGDGHAGADRPVPRVSSRSGAPTGRRTGRTLGLAAISGFGMRPPARYGVRRSCGIPGR